jgi:PAS domain S-box-containing protein
MSNASHEDELAALREELARSRQQLVEAQQLAKIGSWEWNVVSGEVTWSDELFRIYGLEPGSIDVSYEDFLARVHPDDREQVDQRNRRCFETHEPFEDVKRIHRADGTLFLMRTRGELVCDADGLPLRMIGICEDVTERERVEVGELRRRRAIELNDTVIQTLALAAYSLDGDVEKARRLVHQALEHCQRIVDELLAADDGTIVPGALRRQAPAGAG